MSNDYPVGYRKPPTHTRFQAGQSGNPKGRRKGSRNLATDVARELAETFVVTEGGRPRRISKQQAIIKALVAKCIRGDVRAAATILRLLPDVEREKKAEAQAQIVSPVDDEILQAFREQILAEARQEERSKGSK